jgi:hypothetical protein
LSPGADKDGVRARFLLVALVVLPACGRTSVPPVPDQDAVRQAYQNYREAMAGGDLARLTKFVSRERAKELSAPNASETLQVARAFSPAGAQITGVELNASEATLELTARVDEGTATGTVRLVKEDGAWKVSKEDWQVKISIGADRSPAELPPDAVRPADYATLLGTWQGGEGGSSEWTFTFANDYVVLAEHRSGSRYRGQAAIFWDLGADSGGLRVPPGWSVLDVQVDGATEPQYIGQVSLGTFSRQGDTLKFCGSEPGAHVRTESFDAPPAGVRCLTLVRIGSHPPA